MSDSGEVKLKIPHIQRVRRNGKLYLYFRKGDFREGPLANADGTEALRDEVNLIVARLAKAEQARKPKPGTVGGLLEVYERSDAFRSLAFSTQGEYGRLVKELKADCWGVRFPADVTRSWLREMRSVWAGRGYKAANDRMQVLKNALADAVSDALDTGELTSDPFHKLKKVKRPHDAVEVNLTWNDAEVEAAIAEALRRDLPGLARAVALGRWGGFRRRTIAEIPLHARMAGADEDGLSETRLYWVTEKRKVLCNKPEDPRLTALLGRTPNKALTVAYNANGAPWKPRQLNQALDRVLDSLAKRGGVRSSVDAQGAITCPLTIHGLRHARGVELAESGASDAEIMSQLEHATSHSARIYRRQAERKKLAASGQAKVNAVVQLKAARKAKVARNEA